jgi:hypothetical protein
MTATRKRRGAETQRVVADAFKQAGWLYAEPVGAGAPGRDLTGVPGVACEIKSRRSYDPIAWLKQAVRNAGGDLPAVIHRPDGYGPATVDEWPVTLRLADFLRLLRDAGYGGTA